MLNRAKFTKLLISDIKLISTKFLTKQVMKTANVHKQNNLKSSLKNYVQSLKRVNA